MVLFAHVTRAESSKTKEQEIKDEHKPFWPLEPIEYLALFLLVFIVSKIYEWL